MNPTILKIGPLPDRTPSKMTITIDPDLKVDLADYAVIYSQTYGQEVKAVDLVPAMLRALLESDAGFKRARKTLGAHPA